MKLKAYAAVTHQGPYLDVNEDGYDFDLDHQIFYILDGMGGSGVGDKAVTRLKEDLKKSLGQLTSDPDATMPMYWSPRWLLEGNALINSMLKSHQALFKENSDKKLNQRGAASFACCLKVGGILLISQVGSCQVFLLRKGHTEPLFMPTTYSLLSANHQGPRALGAPAGAFGFFPELSWQMKELRLQTGDAVVLLTEGIAPWVSLPEVGHFFARPDGDLQTKLNGLLKLSNSRGNTANQTGMVLEF